MKLEDQDLQLLEKWLEDPSFVHWAEQSNEQDIAYWEHYFNVHPEHWELAKIGRSLVKGVHFRSIPVDKSDGEQALTRLLDRLDSGDKVDESPEIRRAKSLRFRWSVAATLLLLIVCGGGYFTFLHNPKIMLTTQYGERLETILPDSSVVHLNANSQLVYCRRNPRKVWLEGEAFFEIARQPDDARFQVVTTDLAVTVLGTAFNVNARNDQTEVFLEEGKVTLEMGGNNKPTIEMEPGDLVAYSLKKDNLLEKYNDSAATEVVSWRDGTLIFDNTLLSEAFFEIEDIYGIQFVIQSEELLDESITGGVPIEDLEVTLETLRNVYGLQIEIVGKRYLISAAK